MGLFKKLLGNLPIVGKIADIGLGFLGKKSAEKREDSSIQRRVKDAQKAGVHPLAALGANVMSMGPASVGGSDFADLGQDVSRAVAAGGSSEQRATRLEELAIERGGLENDLLRTQISQMRRPAVGPAMPGVLPHKIVPPQKTPNLQAGLPFETNPNFTDAQSYEDRYGDSELVSLLTAMGISAADAYWNLKDQVIGSYKRDKRFLRRQWRPGSRNYSRPNPNQR